MADYKKEPAQNKIMDIIRSKGFIVVTVIVLFMLLAWSVMWGNQRRQAAALDKKLKRLKLRFSRRWIKQKMKHFEPGSVSDTFIGCKNQV
ncbi:hypothetical protein IPM65_01085 [Candidatus Roizmanbacteria bacterium]|nr:MAG: hypothetical protein IPM65_01085 [Candidatus Roizmanbacteria bacterium]